MKPLLSSVLCLLLLLAAAPARAQDYRPADESQRPEGGSVKLLPDQFLRGFDPVTVYFPDNVGPGKQSADDGAKRLKVVPSWPGQWFWADRKTLQFRPAEPWPALARFSFEAEGARKVLTTMMSAPSSMSPQPDSTDLRPFRTITLTFPQALPLDTLKKMLRLEVRDLPGLADSPTRVLKEWTLSQLPRGSQREQAVYALTLEEDVPEGKQLRVNVSLALGDEDKVLWVGRLSTRPAFHLQQVLCGGGQFSLTGGASTPRDMALACGNQGDLPQLVFSAPVEGLTLTTLKKLVRLEPAVQDLHFQAYGSRVTLRGRFVPDTLYRMRIGAAPLQDDSGRPLRDPGDLQIFFHLDFKQPFLRWMQATAVLEAKGPRMLPLQGYGDARADVRIYRVDPLHPGLWPFPSQAIVVNEQSAPPFPGEEPAARAAPAYIGQDELTAHIRLLGSPLVSTLVDLPLARRGGTTTFGLDLAPLLNPVVGKARPGTYLVGLRRLTGAPERAYVRVQVTNLSLSTVEERDKAVFFVRTLDEAREVRGARIVIEGQHRVPNLKDSGTHLEPFQQELTTDAGGRAVLGPQASWAQIDRVSVRNGEDMLVLSPNEAPVALAHNHWSPSSGWLGWLGQNTPPPPNDGVRGFLFTERPIYRPGEKVFVKGFLRKEVGGDFVSPGDASTYQLRVKGPGGKVWNLPLNFTALYGLSAEFQEDNAPTGEYEVVLEERRTGLTFAARTFQVEAYRLPTFEVQLSAPVTARLDGPFQVKAVARYYAGGNVAGQPIAWSVTRRPHYYVPKGREGFLFASSTQFAREGQGRAPEVITRGATLDDNGADEISVNPALDLDGSARIYRFEATVTGADNQPVSATQEVKALPPFVLGLKLPRYSDKPFTLTPELIAVGVNDKTVKGQEVLVRLYKRVWHSQLRETHFATGEARYVTEQEDVKLAEKTVTTEEAPVSPAFELKDAGVYVVELVARDKLGRVQTLSADLYVGGQTPVAWQKSRQGIFGLAGDKASYKPGETARLILQSPFQEGRALVVVEEPGGNTYTWHEVSGGKAVHELAIRPQHVPNVPVHVLLMRGRLGEGDKDDARYRPQTLGASLDVKVEPVSNQVVVELKHPETARPAATVPVELSLKDPQGKPLAGEVTLWLVDEAVLSLAPEKTLNPLDELIQQNSRGTSVRDTRNNLVGKLFEQEEEPGGDGGEEEESEGGSKRVVRKNFQTVPYYQATLQVPASGKLTVQVPLSDDLTNFRVRAVAASGLQRFGYKQTVLRVRLPVLVQPQLPRFVRQGDRFWGGAVGRVVEGSGGPGTVKVRVTGPADMQPLGKDVELQANRAMSFVTPITVKSADVSEAQSLKVRVDLERKSDKAGDAFEIQLPVLPDRTVEHFAYFDTLKAGTAPLKPLPEPARPGTASQEVFVTSIPGVLEFISGLEYLAAYPHGCLEQKLSQLLPDVAQAAILRELGMRTPFGKQINAHVQRLQEEMGLYQDEQGLMAFWPGGPGDVQVTAQAVEFLDAARRSGLKVDEKLQTRAVEGLKRVLRSDYPGLVQEWRYSQRTAALRALTRVGSLDEHYLVDLFQLRERLDTQSLADLASTMSTQPTVYRTNLETLRTELWDSVIIKLRNGKPVFEGLNWRRSSWDIYGFLTTQPSSVAAVFEALLRLDPTNERHDQLRDALLSYASAERGFGSTQENRRALAALALYLEKARPALPDTTVTLSSGATLQVGKDKKTAREEVAGDAALSATVKGGPVGVRVEARYVPATPGDQVTALKQGFIVSRSATWLHADGSEATRFDDKAGEVHALQVGDILELHTSLVTEQARQHVALVVPFAAGLEPLNPALANASSDAKPSQADSTQPDYVQRLDHEVRYYFLNLSRGTHTFHFRARAATEGSFVHPAPRAELMYRESVRGRGEGLRVVVQGEHEK